MSNPDGIEERYGEQADIVATRYCYDTRSGREHVDFDGRLWTIEAVAVKKTTRLSPQELLDGAADSDPEAVRALVWMLRKHRGGEDKLTLGQVDIDLTSIRRYNLDADGVRVRVRDPDLDWAAIERVQTGLAGLLPDLPAEDAEGFAIAAYVSAQTAAGGPGEGDAGGQPAPDSPTTSNEPSPSGS